MKVSLVLEAHGKSNDDGFEFSLCKLGFHLVDEFRSYNDTCFIPRYAVVKVQVPIRIRILFCVSEQNLCVVATKLRFLTVPCIYECFLACCRVD